jgi:hypothetical protein
MEEGKKKTPHKETPPPASVITHAPGEVSQSSEDRVH